MNGTTFSERSLNDLYSALPTELRLKLTLKERTITAPGGTILVQHGTPLQSLIILNSGAVRLSVPCNDRAVSFCLDRTGSVLGMRALLSGEPSEMEIACLKNCQITLLDRKMFLRLLATHPEIHFAIAGVLSSDLRIADKLLLDFKLSALRRSS